MDNALLNNQLILYNSCPCCAPFLNDCVNISRQRSEIYLICRLLFPQLPAGTVAPSRDTGISYLPQPPAPSPSPSLTMHNTIPIPRLPYLSRKQSTDQDILQKQKKTKFQLPPSPQNGIKYFPPPPHIACNFHRNIPVILPPSLPNSQIPNPKRPVLYYRRNLAPIVRGVI